MKKVKVLVASVLFCAMGFVGYNTYNKITMSEADKFMKANVEALTLGEPGGDSRYPDRGGNARFCTLYIYTKGSIKIRRESIDHSLEGEYTRSTVEGLKDRCPNTGNGCNPYSCQEVSYQ